MFLNLPLLSSFIAVKWLESTFEDENDEQSKYNYNLTDYELLRTDEKVDFYGIVFEPNSISLY